METRQPTLRDCLDILPWRAKCMETLRTPHEISPETQTDFYRWITAPDSKNRYWSFYGNEHLLAFGGLTDIQWENSIAEISLLVNPEMQGKGWGEKAVDKILNMAWHRFGLKTIFGECYKCNPDGKKFWEKIILKYGGSDAVLPNRKFWEGEHHDSYYFSIDREEYTAIHGT